MFIPLFFGSLNNITLKNFFTTGLRMQNLFEKIFKQCYSIYVLLLNYVSFCPSRNY